MFDAWTLVEPPSPARVILARGRVHESTNFRAKERIPQQVG